MTMELMVVSTHQEKVTQINEDDCELLGVYTKQKLQANFILWAWLNMLLNNF